MSVPSLFGVLGCRALQVVRFEPPDQRFVERVFRVRWGRFEMQINVFWFRR